MIPPPLTSVWFARFRVLFGLYLTIHFGSLIPWSAELFSRDGILPDPSLNPLAGLFPNPLVWWNSPVFATTFTTALTLLSIGLTLGWQRRLLSILLWFGSTALFHRNNLTSNPALAYLGLLLVLCSLIPTGEKLNPKPARDPDDFPAWRMPAMIPICAWVLLAVGYTFSGLTKWDSPSWQDGTAIARLLDSPLARPGFIREAVSALPDWALKSFSWGSLWLEILFLPLGLHPVTRKWAWMAMTGMHLGILFLIDFADLTFGMLMIHAFTFNPAWLSGIAFWRSVRLEPAGESTAGAV
ncbi:MAG: hypothetical protein JWL81_33 [Verrucomicrobiales bacterium]|nr:hypothetical protein [Verrucomicrobiales bacterium]